MPSGNVPESSLVIRLDLLQREITNITSWQLENSYLESTDAWSATIYDTDRSKLFDLELQPVELLINGASQLLGRIEQTEIGNNGGAITLTGRDYISDMVECNVDPSLTVNQNDILDTAIARATFPVGIDTIFSDDDISMREIRSGRPSKTRGTGRGHRRKSKKLDEYKPKPGEGIYQYLSRLVARFGCTIQPGPTRSSLVICAPRYDQDPLYKIVRTDDPLRSIRNNVISSSAVRDYSRFPTYALITGTHVGSSGSGVGTTKHIDLTIFAAGFNDELGRILDDRVWAGRRKFSEGETPTLGLDQLYRLLYFKDEASRNQEQLDQAAQKMVGERLKDTLMYTVTLRGHVDPESGAVWAVDTMVDVDDAICNVHEPLWIAKRTLSFDEGAGATTQLTCMRPHSFQIGDDQ